MEKSGLKGRCLPRKRDDLWSRFLRKPASTFRSMRRMAGVHTPNFHLVRAALAIVDGICGLFSGVGTASRLVLSATRASLFFLGPTGSPGDNTEPNGRQEHVVRNPAGAHVLISGPAVNAFLLQGREGVFPGRHGARSKPPRIGFVKPTAPTL